MVDAKNGARVLVINAMGRIFMDPLDDPFTAIERELAACALKSGADAIIIDMHCEATSEKQAMGYFGDGRASLVVGTHTHAPTADHRILPGGTAFMSDVGMTGDYESVIGMNNEEPLGRFLRRISQSKFEPANGPGTLCGVAVETDDATGLAAQVGAGAARRQAGRGAGRRSGSRAWGLKSFSDGGRERQKANIGGPRRSSGIPHSWCWALYSSASGNT